MAKEKISFEKSVARLDEIVKLLEEGNAPLEDSLTLFEEGTALVKSCRTMLNTAEQKVVRLMKNSDGEPLEMPFSDKDMG